MQALALHRPLTARQKRLLLAGGAAVALAVVLYKSDAVGGTRRYFARLRAALLAYVDALSAGADTVHTVLADLQRFLASDATDVPPRLRQLARLLASEEAAATTQQHVTALVRGVAGGLGHGDAEVSRGSSGAGAQQLAPASPRQQQPWRPPGARAGALDRLIEAALSERGQSLVSVAVSLGARNLVSSFLETQHRLRVASGAPPRPDIPDRLLAFLAQPAGQQVVALATGAFVSHGVRSYMDESMEVNVYEDIFASISKPQHLEAVKACVGTFARAAVSAAVAAPPAARLPQPQLPPPELLAPSRLPSLPEELTAMPSMAPSAADEQGSADAAAAIQQQQGRERLAPSCVGSAAADRASEWLLSRHDDLDSDSLLHTSNAAAVARRKAAGSPVPAASADSGASAFAVGTPLGADSPASKPPHPAAAEACDPQQHQQQLAAHAPAQPAPAHPAAGWIAAIGREWLNVVRDPHGREVMKEVAGAAAKEAVRGVSASLSEHVDASWFVLAAFAALVCAWLFLQLLQLVVAR